MKLLVDHTVHTRPSTGALIASEQIVLQRCLVVVRSFQHFISFYYLNY